MLSRLQSAAPVVLLAVAMTASTCQVQVYGGPFVRGDVDANRMLQITDAIHIFRELFAGLPTKCPDVSDVDDSGTVELTDGIFLLNYLFLGGPNPAAPFPFCGLDPTPDGLRCLQFAGCFCAGFAGFPCDPGEFCDLEPGSCQGADFAGECVPVETIGCPEIFDPVCGCDGVTYDNDCFRIMAFVSKDHDGPCAGR